MLKIYTRNSGRTGPGKGWLSRAVFLCCLMAFATPGKTQFTLYQRIFQTGVPGNLAPYLQPYIIDYGAAVTTTACKPNAANLQQYAATGLANPAQPVSFDVELPSWPGYTTTAFTDSLNNYIQIVNDFKTNNTLSKVGFYSLPPKQVFARMSNVNSSFAPTSQAMIPLANAVDYFSPDFYNYSSTDTADWRQVVDTTLAVIRKYYGTSKPIYPYISEDPQSIAVIDSSVWLYDLNYLYTRTQGALVWSGYSPNWDPNAPWWRCTKMFLANKGLVPPFVLDNFSVSNVGAAGISVAWTTSSDTISRYFVLQRGTDSLHFTTVSGQVNKAGYSYNQNQYLVTDSAAMPAGGQTLYYRLAITDVHNNVTYSPLLPYTKYLYRSLGGGVKVDLRSAANWLRYDGSAWITAPTAPSDNLVRGDTVIIRPGDTLQAPTQYTTVPSGVVLLDSGQIGTLSWGFGNYGAIVFTGAGAQSVPGTKIAEGATWGNLIINDAAGVRITQGSGDNLLHINSLLLQTGTLTVNADSGHAVALYLDGALSGSGGHLAVTASGPNEGVILDGTVAQSMPGGFFLNNTVPTLTLSNPQGVSYGGPLTVSRTTRLAKQAAFSVAGDYTMDSLSIDTLGSYSPVTVSGKALLNGVLTIRNFVTGPVAGQQFVILSADSIVGQLAVTPVLPAGYAGTVATVGHRVVLTVGTPYTFTDSLLTTADAFVKSGTGNVNTNFGAASYLGAETGFYETYLRFNTGSITAPVSNAQLRLYNMNALSTTWQLYKVNASGNGWTEGGITWNNKPAADTLLGSYTSPAGTGFVYWDITSRLNSLLPAAEGTVSFKVVSTSESYDAFSSKETAVGVQRPYLMLNKTVPRTDSIAAIADAFVKSSTPTTNYGFNSYLAAYNGFYDTYLKFDLHGIRGRVVDGQLRLYSLAGAATQWQVYKVNNNSWTESGLTWSNQPGGDTLLATNDAPASAGYVYWDIAAALHHLGADSILSVEVVATAGVYSSFGSRQGTAAQAPVLILMTDTSGKAVGSITARKIPGQAFSPVVADSVGRAFAGLSIYPNPVSGACTIVSAQTIRQIAVYNNAGRMVHKVEGVDTSRYNLNLSELPPGMYYLRINKETTGKLMKVE